MIIRDALFAISLSLLLLVITSRAQDARYPNVIPKITRWTIKTIVAVFTTYVFVFFACKLFFNAFLWGHGSLGHRRRTRFACFAGRLRGCSVNLIIVRIVTTKCTRNQLVAGFFLVRTQSTFLWLFHASSWARVPGRAGFTCCLLACS